MSAWFTTEEINETTYAVSEYGHWEQAHSYLLIGTEKAALVDTGLGIGNIREVVTKLTKLPITVITTHNHWDHIGGHGYFDDIRIHKLDAEWMIKGLPVPLDDIRKNVMSHPFTKDPPKEFDIKNYTPFTGTPAKLLKDGDLIDLGERMLKIVHTPGHSPGHICVLDIKNGYLLTGDLVYAGKLDCFYESTSPTDFFDSITKINNMPHIKKVLPSHYTLNITPKIIKEIYNAFTNLRDRNLLHHGTGVHKFKRFSIHL